MDARIDSWPFSLYVRQQNRRRRNNRVLFASLALGVIACRPALVSSTGEPEHAHQSQPSGDDWLTRSGMKGSHSQVKQTERIPNRVESVTVLPTGQYLAAAKRVARYRDWPSFPPVPILSASRTTLVDWLDQEQQAEIPRRARVQLAQMMTMLALVEPGFDWDESLLRTVVDNLAGAYLTTRKAIVVRKDLPASAWSETLFHEVVHSIQDRLYGLGDRTRYASDRGDAIAAVHTLAEGEALSLEADEQLGSVGAGLSTDMVSELSNRLDEALSKQPGLPPIVQHSLAAPYLDGLVAVNQLRRLGGWKAVEEVWSSGPQSTHELLHPKLKVPNSPGSPNTGRPPFQIPVPTLLFQNQGGVLTDIMGEQGLRVILEQTLPRGLAAQTAEIWRGDRLAVGEEDGVWRVGWRIRSCGTSSSGKLAGQLATAMGFTVPKLANGAFSVGLCVGEVDGRVRTMVVDNCDIVVAAEWREGETSVDERHSFCERGARWAARILEVDRAECPLDCNRE
jgi:hypothetical protein